MSERPTMARTGWVVRGHWGWRPLWLIALGFYVGCAIQGNGWWFRTVMVAFAVVMAIPKRMSTS